MSSMGFSNAFIQKLDGNGNFIWAKNLGGFDTDIANSIKVDAQKNVYSVGHFRGNADFNPGTGTNTLSSAGFNDAYFSKLDSNGNYVWAGKIGSSSFDEGNCVEIGPTGKIFVAGKFRETPDFDPSNGNSLTTSAGFDDGFLVQLYECTPTYFTDVVAACQSYTWINGVTYTFNNNTATYTLINAQGCDSIITLNLTLNYVNVQVSQSGGVLTSLAGGAAYQWLDCNNGYAAIPGQTNSSFSPSQSGSYAVEVTQGNCTDTSACLNFTMVALEVGQLREEMVLFPNPSTGKVTVQFEEAVQGGKLRVYNALGQRVSEKTLSYSQSQTFEFNLPKGNYWFEIQTDSGKRHTTTMQFQ
jgi:hypothetical protein